MCGRFVVDDAVWTEVERLTGWLDRTALKSGDCFPSQKILILRNNGMAVYEEAQGKNAAAAGGKRASAYAAVSHPVAYMARWGYPGRSGGRQIINARAETVREKSSFRADFERRRCVIPARGFYEWNAQKEKFYFTGNVPVLYLAGIFNNDPEKECVTILTTQANSSIRPVHDRMPVLIPEDEICRWMGNEEWAVHFLQEQPPLLKREKENKDYEQLSLF